MSETSLMEPLWEQVSTALADANQANEEMGEQVNSLSATDPKLTVREEEIVRLAALGLPNQKIAEQLFISVKTVKTHLQNAYPKLGVRKRSELRNL
jgi:DNA-binding NarL/FixJ family response regulator